MKRRVLLINVLILLVLASFVHAASIENAAFTTSSGEEISLVGSAATLIVNFEFDILSDEKPSEVTIDLSQINGNSYDTLKDTTDKVNDQSGTYKTDIDVTSSCVLDAQSTNLYSCKATSLRLRPDSQDIQVPIMVNAATVETFTQSFTFTTDTQQPIALDFYTDYCMTEGCYISKNSLTTIGINVEDDNPLNPSAIIFQVGNSQLQSFMTCEGSSCEYENYYYTGSCEGGESVAARLNTQSRDALGNRFVESIVTNFICDEKRPGEDTLENKNSGIEISYDVPPEPYVNFKSGDDVEIYALVSEDASGVSAWGNFSTLLDTDESVYGDCNKVSEGTYNCSWQVSDVVAGTHRLEFSFLDGAGKESFPITDVLYVDEFVNNASEEDMDLFFDLDAPNVQTNSPAGYSRLAIDIAVGNGMEYPIYATFEPNAKEDDIEILRTNIQNCIYTDGINSTTASFVALLTVPNEYYKYNDSLRRNRININFQDNLNSITNKFDFICEAQLTVRKEGMVYNSPATFNITIPITLKDSTLDTIGARYAEKIKKKEERVDNGIGKVVGQAGEVLAKVASVCSVVDKVTTVSAVLTGAETTLTGMGASGIPGASQAGTAGSKALAKVTDPLNEILGNTLKINLKGSSLGLDKGLGASWLKVDSDDNIFDIACKAATCSGYDKLDSAGLFGEDMDLDGFEESIFGDSESESKNVWGEVASAYEEDLFTNIGVPDPQESVISAVEAKCLPAIIYQVEKFREMECAQLACYKWTAQMGLDISTCDRMKSQAMCQTVIGEAFAVSPTKSIEDLADNANAILQNALPSAIKNVAEAVVCKALEKPGAKDNAPMIIKLGLMIGCELPKSIGQISYQISDSRHSTNTFQYPDLSGCDFALCNGDTLDDCASAGTVPPYLQQYQEQALPVQEIATLSEWPIEDIRASMERIASTDPKSITDTDKKILELYTKYDYDEEFSKATTDAEQKAVNAELIERATIGSEFAKLAQENDGRVIYNQETKQITIDWSEFQSGGDKNYLELGNDAFEAAEKLDTYAEKIKSSDYPNYVEYIDSGVYIFDEDSGTLLTKIPDSPAGDGNYVASKLSASDAKLFEKYNDAKSTATLADTQFEATRSSLEAKLKTLVGTSDMNDELKAAIQAELDKLQNGEMEELLEEARERSLKIRDQNIQAGISLATNMLVTQLLQDGNMKWLQWEEGTGFGNMLNGVDNLLNSQKRQQLICNELTTINTNDGFEENVIQCNDDNFCAPVLSFAAEKIKINPEQNDDQYLYTATWFVGNVVDDNSQLQDEDKFIRYNVFLVGGGNPELPLHVSTWAEIPYGTEFDNVQTSFNTTGEYEEICFRFDKNFPPDSATNGLTGKDEFCRDIKDTTTESSFDTGDPSPVDYFTNNGNTDTDNGFELGVGE